MTTRQQQAEYLQAMGIQPWVLREAPRDAEVQSQEDVAPVSAAPGRESEPPPVVREAVINERVVKQLVVSEQPAAEMRMDDEPPMPTDDFMASLEMHETEESAVAVRDVSKLDWPELQTTVSDCTACELSKTRKQAVFGVGAHNAEWMIVGEAPGADEDQQGEPFIGPSGQLLNNMLRALGLKREQVFIANVLKCHPPENRNPHSDEFAQCEAFLQRQVALVKPKLILAVGGVAAHNLLKLDTPVSKLRGQVHRYGDVPLVVTYHPAYLLRKPSEKAKSWADLKFAASVVKGEQP